MTRAIGFLIFDGFQILDAAGPIAAFEIAGAHVRRRLSPQRARHARRGDREFVRRDDGGAARSPTRRGSTRWSSPAASGPMKR